MGGCCGTDRKDNRTIQEFAIITENSSFKNPRSAELLQEFYDIGESLG